MQIRGHNNESHTLSIVKVYTQYFLGWIRVITTSSNYVESHCFKIKYRDKERLIIRNKLCDRFCLPNRLEASSKLDIATKLLMHIALSSSLISLNNFFSIVRFKVHYVVAEIKHA